MNTRSNFSAASSARLRSAVSKGWASTPLLRSALSTPAPDISDTSRSAERPPNSTQTLPNWLDRSASSRPLSLRSQFGRYTADRAGAHGHDNVAVAHHIQNRCRHVADIFDEHRFHLADHAQRVRQRTTVGGHNRRLAG